MLFRKANKEINENLKNQLQTYIGMLRGLYIIHQHAHLISQGKTSYSDHLLFENLYKKTEEHIDQVFEKIIGSFGVECADLMSHIEKTYKFVESIEEVNEEIVSRSLLAEETFLNFAIKLHENLEKENVLSFGLEDILTTISSDHEDFVYLLKQRIEE